jgi:hypothetical protein
MAPGLRIQVSEAPERVLFQVLIRRFVFVAFERGRLTVFIDVIGAAQCERRLCRDVVSKKR